MRWSYNFQVCLFLIILNFLLFNINALPYTNSVLKSESAYNDGQLKNNQIFITLQKRQPFPGYLQNREPTSNELQRGLLEGNKKVVERPGILSRLFGVGGGTKVNSSYSSPSSHGSSGGFSIQSSEKLRQLHEPLLQTIESYPKQKSGTLSTPAKVKHY